MIASVNPLPEWGHSWTRKMTPSIPIFRNEINALEDFRGGVKVARDFALKHRHPAPRGRVLLQDRLVWLARDPSSSALDNHVSLAVLEEPSLKRTIAIERLERFGFRWRIACTSNSANGLNAAILGGLGVGVRSQSLLTPELSKRHRHVNGMW